MVLFPNLNIVLIPANPGDPSCKDCNTYFKTVTLKPSSDKNVQVSFAEKPQMKLNRAEKFRMVEIEING